MSYVILKTWSMRNNNRGISDLKNYKRLSCSYTHHGSNDVQTLGFFTQHNSSNRMF